jgi:hypothetical protein
MSGATYVSLTMCISFVNTMISSDISAYVTFALHLLWVYLIELIKMDKRWMSEARHTTPYTDGVA